VRVVLDDGSKRLTLDDEQKWLFAGELAKARTTHATKGAPPLLAADCWILLRGRGWAENFEIYGNTVLRNADTDESWQFYFGMVMLEWLHG
jgi:hypothetical protein